MGTPKMVPLILGNPHVQVQSTLSTSFEKAFRRGKVTVGRRGGPDGESFWTHGAQAYEA